jgi:methylated-DNA-[protein]-cysteine S-methyltransferase
LTPAAAHIRQPEHSLWWTTFDSPIGQLHAFSTTKGLCRIFFRSSDAHALERMQQYEQQNETLSPERNDAGLHPAKLAILEFLAGKHQQAKVRLDLGNMRSFQRRVLEKTQAIKRGCVATYGDIAHRIGLPGAAQAVGQALGHNPLPIVIPCHRVVAAQGDLGGFTGGLPVKIDLLTLEGVPLVENQPQLDFE